VGRFFGNKLMNPVAVIFLADLVGSIVAGCVFEFALSSYADADERRMGYWRLLYPVSIPAVLIGMLMVGFRTRVGRVMVACLWLAYMSGVGGVLAAVRLFHL
jgi:hypothetical protein